MPCNGPPCMACMSTVCSAPALRPSDMMSHGLHLCTPGRQQETMVSGCRPKPAPIVGLMMPALSLNNSVVSLQVSGNITYNGESFGSF